MIHYDLYESPTAKSEVECHRSHARVVDNITIDSEHLAESINRRCTLTRSDVKAVLSALHDQVVEHLLMGNRVCLEGLGYLSVNLGCDIKEIKGAEQGDNVHVTSVAFRAEKSLMKELRFAKFKRSHSKSRSLACDDNLLEESMTNYFSSNAYLTRRKFQALMGQTIATANRILARLVKEGKLCKEGSRAYPLYMPQPGCYGK